MSVGSHIQLAAKGPQDLVIYGAESGGPFTSCFRTHTPFAIDTKDLVFPEGCSFGKSSRLTVPRSGDMLGNIVLEITLPIVPGASPTDAWVDTIGYVLLRRIKFTIDDTEISNTERLWYDISDRLFLKEGHRAGLHEMIGKNRTLTLDKTHTVHVPLKLFCCKTHRETQQFLPLLTAPGSRIFLDIEIESFDNCVQAYSGTLPPMSFACTALVDYVFLETAEKERMINRPHTLLVETEQDAEALTYKEVLSSGGDARIPLDSVKVDLSEINYPVKYLAWVCYANSALQTKSYFTYTDDIQRSLLLLDGVERFPPQNKDYFQMLEKFYGCRRAPAQDGVFVYNFGLDATSWQPCGHCTFGEVSLPILQVDIGEKRTDRVIKVFVVGYKFLDIEHGRVNVRFS
jgi:hypothetical protein